MDIGVRMIAEIVVVGEDFLIDFVQQLAIGQAGPLETGRKSGVAVHELVVLLPFRE